ncbi:uncharacterized protein LOC122504616 [Leptopilina heterotoma]|uniref:uncharacterized protein LOC122504616 n=1 Tax=Leptopilina heterotoma TaxID=63436 RepID=UPI001CA7EC46|nr:uncharacterized protein LOC122504616 [Leptopilina heterotoma]
MADEQLKLLKKQRGNIKRLLTCSETVLTSINETLDLDSLHLEERLKKHTPLWESFDKIQSEIETILDDETETVGHETERTSFENRYYEISGSFNKFIKKQKTAIINNPSQILNVVDETNSESNQEQNSSTTVPIQSASTSVTNEFQTRFPSRFELPKLQTPTFQGGYDTWLTFHDSFKSMCHDNPTLSSIQKFHYLKACLKDEAAELIASIETTSQNYFVAWELLKNRYDNRKYIVESHIKALFDIQNVSKEMSIRALLDNVQKRVRALRALEQPVDQWDSLLIHIVKEKLYNYTREKWEESVGSTKLPTFPEMISFLERRSLIENSQSVQKSIQNPKVNNTKNNSNRSNVRGTTTSCMSVTVNSNATKTQSQAQSCPLCSKNHMLWQCDQFLNMSPSQRYEKVKTLSICHNCFFSNHRLLECRRSFCRKCHKRHNTLLHFDTNKSEQEQEVMPEIITTAATTYQPSIHSQVVLGTAIVKILDASGNYKTCRAFLDSGSQCCSISERFAESLNLKRSNVNVRLKGVENIQSNSKYMTSTKIQSLYDNDVNLDVSFLIFQKISLPMPAMPIDRNSLNIPTQIFLADPQFHQPSEIDILIGAEYFYNLMRAGKINVSGQRAILQETDLGWVFSGLYNKPNQGHLKSGHFSTNEIQCNLIKFQELPILWELGNEDTSQKLSKEETVVENHYIETTTRTEAGNYQVTLPFNEKRELLGDSRNTAFQRFYALERKFSKNPEFHSEYSQCIGVYLEKGHMTLIDNNDNLKSGYFLPHHAVIKEDSCTSRTRVVFDGSSKTSSRISLNDALRVGPSIQKNLYSIIARFRSYPYALTADIQQMYRQVLVSEQDEQYQKILWRSNPEEPIKIYSLNRVTFGTASAPYLAIRTLHQLAND